MYNNNSTGFDIYCNETDICKIDCQSKYSCTQANIHCGSSPSRCFVKCDEYGDINCPYSIDGAFNDWVPTFSPSLMPITIPSLSPTIIPSSYSSTSTYDDVYSSISSSSGSDNDDYRSTSSYDYNDYSSTNEPSDDTNTRSWYQAKDYCMINLLIDDWTNLYNGTVHNNNTLIFDKVKVTLYKDVSEVRYFVYKATGDLTSWYNQDYLIDSSFKDAGYEDYDQDSFWSIEGVPI